MIKFVVIAAVGKNGELGKNNDLIWHIKEDLKYFKEVTTGHAVLMGKNTFNSLPKKLPNRHHIIISTSLDNEDPEVEVFRSIEDFFLAYKDYKEPIYVIGGAQIYQTFLPYAKEMHLTEIDSEDVEATAYFPKFNKEKYDREEISSFEEPVPYKHVLYKKR